MPWLLLAERQASLSSRVVGPLIYQLFYLLLTDFTSLSQDVWLLGLAASRQCPYGDLDVRLYVSGRSGT